MNRIILVQNVADIEGSLSDPKTVVGELRLPDDIVAGITSEARAGRMPALRLLIEERGDGVFIIAGSIHPTPVAMASPSEPVAPPSGDKTEPDPAPPAGDKSETISE